MKINLGKVITERKAEEVERTAAARWLSTARSCGNSRRQLSATAATAPAHGEKDRALLTYHSTARRQPGKRE